MLIASAQQIVRAKQSTHASAEHCIYKAVLALGSSFPLHSSFSIHHLHLAFPTTHPQRPYSEPPTPHCHSPIIPLPIPPSHRCCRCFCTASGTRSLTSQTSLLPFTRTSTLACSPSHRAHCRFVHISVLVTFPLHCHYSSRRHHLEHR